jgi:hypothetical protein
LYKKVKKKELRKCGVKAMRNQYRINSISILAILTNTIRYRYDIDASGIEAEPGPDRTAALKIGIVKSKI